MARFITNHMMTTFFSLSRRMSSIAAQTTRSQAEVTATMKAMAADNCAGSGGGGTVVKADVFWMKNPLTGYWIPENRFNQVDPVDLRAQLLSSKKSN
ncbi:Late embryogenesis abundant protein LEA-3 subgroup protein [Dioscorea alata]|uniref:Late embryogenesis abundant protein LEA-3 subgroup protein n=1 Tax=Dioscorea alata TaxID=55571 RepID=A0ACB7W8D9_DIOAL|nr:Late embryogenesis abundant protein LEA-3 subgroup protein [Dioscorea alata]